MNKQHTRYLTELGVLTAVLLLLETTGLGMIKTSVIEMTILQVPVIVGAILLGPSGGAILGLVFGLISFAECFGKSTFGAELLAIQPFFTFLVCVPTRTLMGWCCGLIFRALHRRLPKKYDMAAFVAASLSGALLNTIFFMTTLCLCFYRTSYIQGFVTNLGAQNFLLFIVLFVGLQGLIEALVCAVLGSAISKGVYLALHRASAQ